MANLTLREKRLLRYPPTPTTWECMGSHPNSNGERIRCGAICGGSMSNCWLCGKAKGRRPKLVYPAYEAACRKAGIKPGTRWPVQVPAQATVDGEPEKPAKTTRRKK